MYHQRTYFNISEDTPLISPTEYFHLGEWFNIWIDVVTKVSLNLIRTFFWVAVKETSSQTAVQQLLCAGGTRSGHEPRSRLMKENLQTQQTGDTASYNRLVTQRATTDWWVVTQRATTDWWHSELLSQSHYWYKSTTDIHFGGNFSCQIYLVVTIVASPEVKKTGSHNCGSHSKVRFLQILIFLVSVQCFSGVKWYARW